MRIPANEIDVTSMDGLRSRSAEELKENLKTLRSLEVDMKFQRVFGLLENTSRLKQNRRNIARILTVLREKQIQNFLLNDPEVMELVDAGKIKLSAGKNDPPSVITREDLAGNDARSMTLVMRLWARLRKDETFYYRTRHLPRI